jgi:hypothetical protein
VIKVNETAVYEFSWKMCINYDMVEYICSCVCYIYNVPGMHDFVL